MLKNFTDEVFDIVIVAGQSNAEGFSVGNVDKAYEPGINVWYLNNDFNTKCFTITPATEKVKGSEIQSNFGLSFAQEYVKNGNLTGSKKLLIVRTAVGGTGFSDNRWTATGDLYLSMLDMIQTALSLNAANKLVALLWHQGETDAINKVSYDVHYRNLITLVTSVRNQFNTPSLPFIAGNFVQVWREANDSITKPVIDAIKDVCRDCANAKFVETDGLHSNYQDATDGKLPWWSSKPWKDNLHFSRRSAYELGKRYYQAYISISNESDRCTKH